MRAAAIILGVICLAGTAFFALRHARVDETNLVQESPREIVRGSAVFTWEYRSYEQEGIPYSDVRLTARYEDGTTQAKAIDSIEGSCNEYAERDADAYENSAMIICYYAGLGRYYKVVEQDGKYLVQRKVFEEASPDYRPPIEEFETIATF